MSNERLTRHEISWLLAQEARGAAKALREDVTRLTHAPPAGDEALGTVPGLHTTLDALDGAIGMLSALQTEPLAAGASRRGRIDLAFLLYEVAPQARIKMAPGEGTEVFGDERELRRILHLLVNQTHANPSGAGATASPEVDIRRDGELVKISVDLGPDSSATAELERRWLSRMAIQHGGRLEFKGGKQSVFLPADGASDQREVVELRRELEQAQQLGEAYARELAGVFAAGLPVSEASPPQGPSDDVERFETLLGLAGRLEATLRDWTEASKQDAALAARELGDGSELAQRLARRLTALQDLQRELGAIAHCPTNEHPVALDASRVAKDTLQSFEARAARHHIDITLVAPDDCRLTTRPEAFRLMLRALVEHALSATPQGKSVHVEITATLETLEVCVVDAGPNVPASARHDVLCHAMDPTRLGRPGGIALLAAHAIAGRLGGTLTLDETPDGLTLTRLRLARG